MNPKPLESLNHLTVPLAIAIFLLLLLVDRANLRRGNPVGAGLHVELHLLRLPQGLRAASDDVGLIREDVRTAGIRGDEAEAFHRVEKPDDACSHGTFLR